MGIRPQEQKIREFINNPRQQRVLLSVLADWNRLCSSLDVIGDTELAIDAYPDICNSTGDGKSYIIVYGILQTLMTQQDAVKHICDVLGVSYKLPKELGEIREIRANSIGHPALETENRISKSNFIQRFSLSPTGFELLTVYSDGRGHQIRPVSIPRLIEVQREHLGKMLDEVLRELELEEMKHREAHRDRKVTEVFPPTLDYYFQKIFEASQGGAAFGLGLPHLNFINDCVGKFESELKARGEWGIHDSLDYLIELISYPLDELKGYFSGKRDSKLNDKDAYIFASFLLNQIEILKKIAKEIDEKYAEDP